MIGNSNDETNFPHKLLLKDTQVSKICKVFANGSLANIKFSKTQFFKVVQSGGFKFSDFFNLIHPKIYGTGITLTNNEIKEIMKVIRSLENREILLKELLAK